MLLLALVLSVAVPRVEWAEPPAPVVELAPPRVVRLPVRTVRLLAPERRAVPVVRPVRQPAEHRTPRRWRSRWIGKGRRRP